MTYKFFPLQKKPVVIALIRVLSLSKHSCSKKSVEYTVGQWWDRKDDFNAHETLIKKKSGPKPNRRLIRPL